MSRLGGLVRPLPALFLLYVAVALTVAGVPFTGGFLARMGSIHFAEISMGPGMAVIMEVIWLALTLAVSLKIPYLVFYNTPEYRIPLKKAPLNMYLAAFFGVILLFIIGLRSSDLMALAPVLSEGEPYSNAISGSVDQSFTPYTLWRMLRVTLSICGLALGLAWWTQPVTSRSGRLLDFQNLYRLMGSGIVSVLAHPLAWLDRVSLTSVTGAVAGMTRQAATLAGWLDRTVMAYPTTFFAWVLGGLSQWLVSPRIWVGVLMLGIIGMVFLAWVLSGILV